MFRDRWAVHLCTCNDALPLSPEVIGRLTGMGYAPSAYRSLAREGAGVFSKQKGLGADFHLVCCCSAEESFAPALEEAGIDPGRVHHLDLKGGAFWRAPDAEAAHRLAARLIRSAVARAEAGRPAPPLALSVPASVVIYTDRPEGIRLADRLGERAEVQVILDEEAAGFDELLPTRRHGRLLRGRVSGVKGHLGDFEVTIRTRQAINLEVCTRCGRCAPVCHTQAITPGLRLIAEKCDRCGDCLAACAGIGAIQIPREEVRRVKAGQVVALLAGAPAPEAGRHTGYHLIEGPGAVDAEAVAFRVANLMDDFAQPVYLAYDEKVCAAGSAQLEGCGVCIAECPYDALSRQESRIRVEASACEGCGGCVSACPTSALRFRDPSPEQIDAQLRALLSLLPGEDAQGRRPAVVFHCGEKGAEALRVAGENRWIRGENLFPVAVPCLRFVSEALILHSFRLGAAGVALLGCADCPNGERPLVEARLELCRAVLDGFGLGSGRLALFAVEDSQEAYYLAAAVGELGGFLDGLGPAPLPPPAAPTAPADGNGGQWGNREFVTEALRAFMGATGKQPGRIVGGTPLPYAETRVRPGCTLCAGCVFVCPTHALTMEEPEGDGSPVKRLRFNHLKCVACGMCEAACPEKVVTLERGLSVSREALGYRDLVRDEMIRCISCGREYINKQALDVILAKLVGLDQLGDTFGGGRKNLLRMCPDCRGARAMQEVERGWEP